MTRVLPLFLLLVACSWAGAEEVTHTKDALADIKKAVDDGKAVLVDCREQGEWSDGHLKGAMFLPLSAVKKLKSAPDSLPKDKPVYIHCAAGGRCLKATEILKAMGVDARAIKAGYDELKEKGFTEAPKK
jgi:phage shock protein E